MRPAVDYGTFEQRRQRKLRECRGALRARVLGVLPEQVLLVFRSNTSCVMKVNVWKVSDLQPMAPTFGSHFSLCTTVHAETGLQAYSMLECTAHPSFHWKLHFRKKRKVQNLAKETQKRAPYRYKKGARSQLGVQS